jgi:antitoxin VapB
MTIQLSTDIERLVRLLARATGKAPDEVVKEAIEERARAAGLSVAGGRRPPEEIKRSLNEIVDRIAKLPVLDRRTADEIIGYDELGVSR